MSKSPPPKKLRFALKNKCIRLCVKNASNVSEARKYTSETYIANFPWTLGVWVEAEQLSVQLKCTINEHATLWYCDASVKFSLIKKTATRLANRQFNQLDARKAPSKLFFQPIIGRCTSDEGPEFVKNNVIIVEARVAVLGQPGERFRWKPAFDFRTPSSTSDVTLKVGGVDFYPSKQMLAIHSPYFRMLFAREKESYSFEIVKDIDADIFEVLLRMLHRLDEPFKGQFIILEEAEKSLMSLISDNGKLLLLSDKFKLFHLQDFLRAQLTKDAIKNLRKSAEYRKFSDGTKYYLFGRYLELDSSSNH